MEERPIHGHSQCNLRPQSSFLREAAKFVGDSEAVRKMLRAWTLEQRLEPLWTSQPPGQSWWAWDLAAGSALSCQSGRLPVDGAPTSRPGLRSALQHFML